MRLVEAHYFVIGFMVSSAIVLIPFHFYAEKRSEVRRAVTYRPSDIESDNASTPYDESLSAQLFEKVKILCMVMTHPENHKTKAVHIKNTWGRRCNKLLFISSEDDDELEVAVIHFNESRDILWNKTRESFKYLYAHHLYDFDWFMKADDDNYVVVENLRYVLAQYNPRTAFYFGHRYAVQGLDEGYMAGGGYILSRKAVMKFVDKALPNEKQCHPNGGSEDWEMGRCLAHLAIFVDCRDELHQKRFFPVGVKEHMGSSADPEYWYTRNQYYHVQQGNTSCCSDTSVEYHYIGTKEMYVLDYFIYKVHPFGLDDHSTETLPKRLPLKEIIAAADDNSSSPNFRIHRRNHQLDPSEVY